MPSNPNIDWGKVLSSKAFENVATVAGQGISAYGQAKQDDKNRVVSQGNNAATLMERLLADERARRLDAAAGAADASPLGANENFAARQAIIQQILGGARNFSVTPSDPDVAAAMPTMSGGLRLPEGGFSAESLRPFGAEATAGAIAHRQKLISNIDPTAPTADFSTIGYDDDLASRFGNETADYAGARLASTTANDDKQRALIMQALDRDLTGVAQGEAKKTPMWKKIAKIAAIAAPIVAAPFTGGASLLAIGALSGAANGYLNGGGVKGTLLGAGMGAAGGAAANAAKGAIAGSQALTTAQKLSQAGVRTAANTISQYGRR